MDRRIETYKRYQEGYGEILVQMNVEDTRFGVGEYVLNKHKLDTIELKWGQGAKNIGGEIKVNSLERAQELKKRGYVVLPDPTLPEIKAAFKDGAIREFERHSRVGFVTKEGFLKEVERLRKVGFKRITLKTGAYSARYIIRASFSQERMQYLDQEGKVVYTSKDGRTSKVFPALEWLANLCSHIPNRGEQMVRYYGHYSNVSRGKRQMEGNDDAVPSIIESQGDEKTFRRNWARLIQKIYEVNPLICPKCWGNMRIIISIEDPSVIRAILDHLGIWLVRSRPPPKIHDPPIREYADDFYSDPDYSWDQYIQS
jgi:hypothetical protein